LGSVDAFADPQLAPGWPVPAGFLAALAVTVGTSKTFERVLGCADGAVGLSAQAASAATVRRTGNSFIADSIGMSGSANSIDSRIAFNAWGGGGAFQRPFAALYTGH
jgi:hypothetical protein